jgi:hypothetical protein
VQYERSSDRDQVILANFCQTLKMVQTRHANVIQTMAQGVLELKETHTVDKQTDMAIQYFLDRFYMSRISMRMLIHHVRNNIIKSVRCTKLHPSTRSCSSQILTRTPKGLA